MERESGSFNVCEELEICKKQFNNGKYSSCVERLHSCRLKLSNTLSCIELRYGTDDKSQLAVSKWCIEHNIILCELMDRVNTHSGTISKRFYEFLQDIHGITPTSATLLLEISALYNWISSLLDKELEEVEYSRNELLHHINGALKRYFVVATGSIPSFVNDDADTLLSLIRGIFQHFLDLTEEERTVFTILCSGISWLLLYFGNKKDNLCLLNMISCHFNKESTCQNEEMKMTRFIWTDGVPYSQIPITDWTDVIRFAQLNCFLSQDTNNHMQCEEYLKRFAHMPFFLYLRAVTYFKEEEFSKALDIIQTLWSRFSNAMDKWLKAKVCNMAGCCYSLMGKHHISKERFACAIEEDIGYVLALRNLSAQFRLLKKHNKEIEMLQLLLKVTSDLEKRGVKSHEVSYASALYLLAKRYFDLERYEEAAEQFECLLKLFEEKFAYQIDSYSENSSIPELQVIYHQAAFSYLNARKYDKCIDICQHAVDSYCCGNDMEERSHSYEDRYKNATSDEVSNVRFCIDSKEASLLHHLSSDVMALLMRSAAFYHSGRKDEALSDTKRARSILMHNSVPSASNKSPFIKSSKQVCSGDTGEKESITLEKTIIDYLTSQVLNNLAVFSVEQKHHQEAMHLLRVSLSCLPGNTEAAYNSTVLMARLGYRVNAIQTWYSFKGERNNNFYLSAVSSEQVQKLEQMLNSSALEENTQFKLVLSDKWQFSTYNYNVELGSSPCLRHVHMPLYVNLSKPPQCSS